MAQSAAMATGHHRRTSALNTMHPDTKAAIRLLALALITHEEDAAVLQIYGSMPEHLADVIADYIDDGSDEEEEEED